MIRILNRCFLWGDERMTREVCRFLLIRIQSSVVFRVIEMLKTLLGLSYLKTCDAISRSLEWYESSIRISLTLPMDVVAVIAMHPLRVLRATVRVMKDNEVEKGNEERSNTFR